MTFDSNDNLSAEQHNTSNSDFMIDSINFKLHFPSASVLVKSSLSFTLNAPNFAITISSKLRRRTTQCENSILLGFAYGNPKCMVTLNRHLNVKELEDDIRQISNVRHAITILLYEVGVSLT